MSSPKFSLKSKLETEVVEGGTGTTITPATSVSAETSYGGSSDVGTSGDYARADHKHGNPSNPVTGHESTYSHSGYDSHVAAAAPHSGHAASSHTHTAANITDATATATASKIPIADGSAKLDTWISDTGASTKGKIQLAGDLSGTAASPTVVGIHSGATALAISTIADGEFLKRSGTNIISAAASGTTLTATVTAGENLGQYDAAYCKTSDGKYYKATNAGTLEQSQVVGIITSGAISANATGTITKIGAITNGSWSLTAGAPCWLSTAGGITQTEPTTEDTYWVPLGYAESATSIFLNPQTGILIKAFALPDVVHGRLSLVSATSIKWEFVQSNQIRLYNGSAWDLVKLAAEPTIASTATDLNGTALGVDKVYDIFLQYDGVDSASLQVSRWAAHTAGSSTRNAAYAAGTAYAIGDRVTSGGKDYTCIQAGTGQTPSSSPTYWCDNGTSVSGDFAGLYKQDGVLVSHNSTTGKKLRWLGVIYTYNNTVVNFKDEVRYRYISNYYNAQRCSIFVNYDPADYSLTSATSGRVIGNSEANSVIYFVICATQQAQITGLIFGNNTNAYNLGVGVGINGSVYITDYYGGTTQQNIYANTDNAYAAGLTKVALCEQANYFDTSKSCWVSYGKLFGFFWR